MNDDPTPDTPVQSDAVTPAQGDDPLAGLLGGLDMNSLLSMAGEMQQQMADAQERAAETEVEGTAGGGAVRVSMTGTLECTKISIDPVATEDIGMLEDLVLAAVRDALAQAKDAGGDDPLGGLGGQLGNLFGD